MTFLSLNIDKTSLIMQKDALEYQEMVYSNLYSQKVEELSEYLSDANAEEDAYTKYLETQEQYFDERRTSIESQLKVINSEIESYDKAVDANIKQDCQFKISV